MVLDENSIFTMKKLWQGELQKLKLGYLFVLKNGKFLKD